MTELRHRKSKYEGMAEREVEIYGGDAWRGKDVEEGREHHILSSGSKWCLNVSLFGQVIIFIRNQKGTMVFL